MRTTNPPEYEPERGPEVSLASNPDARADAVTLEVNPESTLRHDVYINKKFVEMFAYEDRSEALARAFEKSLSANDNGGGKAPTANGLVAWFRAAREAEK